MPICQGRKLPPEDGKANKSGEHWILLVADVREKLVFTLNSSPAYDKTAAHLSQNGP